MNIQVSVLTTGRTVKLDVSKNTLAGDVRQAVQAASGIDGSCVLTSGDKVLSDKTKVAGLKNFQLLPNPQGG